MRNCKSQPHTMRAIMLARPKSLQIIYYENSCTDRVRAFGINPTHSGIGLLQIECTSLSKAHVCCWPGTFFGLNTFVRLWMQSEGSLRGFSTSPRPGENTLQASRRAFLVRHTSPRSIWFVFHSTHSSIASVQVCWCIQSCTDLDTC